MGKSNFFQEFRRLRKQQSLDVALAWLQRGLRRGLLEPADTIQTGRLLQRYLADQVNPAPLKIQVLGQFTTSWLAAALTAAAAARGVTALVSEGGYDNVLQDSAKLPADLDVVVLAPWHHRLFAGDDRAAEHRVGDELSYWGQVWEQSASGARLVQIGYDWVHPGAMGHFLGHSAGGYVDLVRRVNLMLREQLPEGVYFVDLEQVSGGIGRSAFYDPRNYFWAKQPLTDRGTVRLAEHVWAGIRAILFGPKKVLVTDLDDTLWGGVVGELGPLGIELGEGAAGEAFRDFQRCLKDLSRRGCLLAACSKNNPEDARAPFAENPEMVLTLEDFAAFEASWEPKERGLAKIADSLRLGLQDFVFFDNDPAERERVRIALPEVEVVEVPPDPSEYVRALQEGLWFESLGLTEEDRQRSGHYRAEFGRRAMQDRCETVDDYLRGLAMIGDVGRIRDDDFNRVVQLIGKTNQFNLTSRRHGAETVRNMLAEPGAIGLAMRMADRFGDHGLIAVILAVPDCPSRTALRVDTWLMSCRVIGRTAEQFLFNRLLDRTRELKYASLIGEYVPTRKNRLVEELYPSLGFVRVGQSGDTIRYELDSNRARPQPTFLEAGKLRP